MLGNNRGLTLIEVMIAASLSVILVFGSMNLLLYTQEQIREINSKQDFELLKHDLETYLSDVTNCTNEFSNQSLQFSNIKEKKGNSATFQMMTLNNGSELSKMKVGNILANDVAIKLLYNHDVNYYSGIIQFTAKQVTNNNSTKNLNVKPRELQFAIKKSATGNRIENCMVSSVKDLMALLGTEAKAVTGNRNQCTSNYGAVTGIEDSGAVYCNNSVPNVLTSGELTIHVNVIPYSP